MLSGCRGASPGPRHAQLEAEGVQHTVETPAKGWGEGRAAVWQTWRHHAHCSPRKVPQLRFATAPGSPLGRPPHHSLQHGSLQAEYASLEVFRTSRSLHTPSPQPGTLLRVSICLFQLHPCECSARTAPSGSPCTSLGCPGLPALQNSSHCHNCPCPCLSH